MILFIFQVIKFNAYAAKIWIRILIEYIDVPIKFRFIPTPSFFYILTISPVLHYIVLEKMSIIT